ncbi:acyltransferase family protein [Burkholderia ubonensis]|uniref:acyltransferase family protein n=1 Tax=Burkholderia ubonensis TaxID=101571 RepID=UPI0009B42C38|nr:acyltransferase family protein [Burkholderia ubonensis]
MNQIATTRTSIVQPAQGDSQIAAAARTSHRTYRPDIDGLRAVAVMAVVAFHAFPDVIRGGFAGVDIFFVISGFLISRIVMDGARAGNFSFVDFYIHRIRRIVPALLVVLVSCYAVGWHLLGEGDFGFLGKHVAGAATFVSNVVLWKESGYFDPDGSTKPLLHLWSLGVEEQFYIVWPVVIVVAVAFRRRLLLGISAIAIGSFAYNTWLISIGSAGAYYSPLSRFWELLAGALGAYLMREHEAPVQRWRDRFGGAAALAGFVLIAGAILLLQKDLPFPGWRAIPPVLGALCIILAGPDTPFNRHVLSNRVLVWIGLISFPLYLWHWPILTLWNLVTTEKASALETAGMVALAVFLAYLVYEFVERPIRRRGGRMVTVVLVILLIGIGYAGYNAFVRGGLPFRSAVKRELRQDLDAYNVAPATAINCSVTEDGNVPPKACLDSAGSAAAPLVFLWGDSHTANVSYGLTSDKLKELGIRLAVAMKGGCPPVIGYQPTQSPRCEDFYVRSLEKLRALKPDVVMLTGSWSLYYEKKGYNELDSAALGETIRAIRQMGVRKIIVVGCFPVFEINLPKLGGRVFIPNERDRTFERFDTTLYGIDARVKEVAAKAGADFISPLDNLCNKNGCVISASSTKYIPVAYDVSHMTYPGSGYFVDRAIRKSTFSLSIRRDAP